MFLFITGGTASGKSEYAEEQAEKLAAAEAASRGDDQAAVIYAATMSDTGHDSLERIKRHKLRRERAEVKIHRNGVKNVNIKYETFECFSLADAGRLAEYAEGRVVLFDCLSGFAANIMFGQPDDASGDRHEPPRPHGRPLAENRPRPLWNRPQPRCRAAAAASYWSQTLYSQTAAHTAKKHSTT